MHPSRRFIRYRCECRVTHVCRYTPHLVGHRSDATTGPRSWTTWGPSRVDRAERCGSETEQVSEQPAPATVATVASVLVVRAVVVVAVVIVVTTVHGSPGLSPGKGFEV